MIISVQIGGNKLFWFYFGRNEICFWDFPSFNKKRPYFFLACHVLVLGSYNDVRHSGLILFSSFRLDWLARIWKGTPFLVKSIICKVSWEFIFVKFQMVFYDQYFVLLAILDSNSCTTGNFLLKFHGSEFLFTFLFKIFMNSNRCFLGLTCHFLIDSSNKLL